MLDSNNTLNINEVPCFQTGSDGLYVIDANIVKDWNSTNDLGIMVDVTKGRLAYTDHVSSQIQEIEKTTHLEGAIRISYTDSQLAFYQRQWELPDFRDPADRTIVITAKLNPANLIVLSGDGKVRDYCREQGLEYHGTFWLMAKAVLQGELTIRDAYDRYQQMINNERWLKEKSLTQFTQEINQLIKD